MAPARAHHICVFLRFFVRFDIYFRHSRLITELQRLSGLVLARTSQADILLISTNELAAANCLLY